MMSLNASNYFNQPGFQRLFAGLQARYASLSRLGGSIRLESLTKEEAESLEGFLQIKMMEKSTVILSVAQIRKALQKTRYAEFSLEELVPLVLEDVLRSNKEVRADKEAERQEFLDGIAALYHATVAGRWLEGVLLSDHPVKSLLQRDYQADRDWLLANLPLILQAINRLPALSGEHLRLPVFAAAVSGNPHYFDEGKRSLTYLLYALRDRCAESRTCGGRYFDGSSTETRAELLYTGGLLKDDLSNWVLCCGIRGYVTGGEMHQGMAEYCRRGEPQILTLQNLSFMQAATITGREVYVVENPSVFSWLVVQNKKDFACICSGGQLRLAVLVLLDLLVKNGVTINYAGDFDPEGLNIAQKLICRYGSRLQLWCYTEEIYRQAMSTETISSRRLKQLENLQDERLLAMGKLLQEYRRPGYQENIMAYLGIGE